MNNLIQNNSLSAVISFEGSSEKLRSCLRALQTWIPKIIIVTQKEDAAANRIVEEFNDLVFIHGGSTTLERWDFGLSEVSTPWVLFIRSNEVVTGQLRKTIILKLKGDSTKPLKYLIPSTMVFLQKRLKYSLDWYDSKLSFLAHLPQGINTINQLKVNRETFEGELISYSENTLADCSKTVLKKAEERAAILAKNSINSGFQSLLFRGLISSIKIFCKTYFLRRGFKEGFEGVAFAVCDAHAELLGYLHYHELYIRGGKKIRDDLTSIKKILVIKLRDIGDNILCTPLIHSLKHHLPEASVSVLTWTYSRPVFENNPKINQLFEIRKEPSTNEINKLLGELNLLNFDLAISTHSGGLSSSISDRVKTKYRIDNRYRGRNKSYNLITPESDYYRSSIERDLDCLRSLGLKPSKTKTELFVNDDEVYLARKTLKAKGLNPEKKTVLIHPTAAVSIREWPLENFNKLIQSLNQKEHIEPIIICSELEYPKIKSLLDDLPDLVIFHQVTVRQMIAIIHECDLVIDNDSSPSHIATALGVPTIVLFSQAIREIFRPYDLVKDQHFVFYNDVDCRECGLTHCNDRICLDFSPDAVFTQALKMLSAKKT